MRNFIVFIIGAFICTISVSASTYDKSSCETLLPVIMTGHSNVWSSSSSDIDGVSSTSSSEENAEKEDIDTDQKNVDLVLALERSPYKIETSCLKYRRNRIMTVKIEGAKMNGLMLQAKQRFPSSLSTRPIFIGNFVDLPEGFDTLDCNSVDSPYKSNAVFNTDRRIRSDVKLNWKAPMDDYGSIEFKATIIRGKYYWTQVKSIPIFFNDFPPSFADCGKDKSCQQYVESTNQCEDGFCKDYALISHVAEDSVTFHLGGKITDDVGFIGVAFTEDEKFTFLDLNLCRKKSHNTVDVVNYNVNKSVGQMVKSNSLSQAAISSVTFDIEENYIWCTFRRPMKLPTPNSINLAKDLYQILIWGKLDPITLVPFLPNEDDMLKNVKQWKATETFNTIDSYGGSNLVYLNFSVIVVSLLVTIFTKLVQ